MRLHRLEAKHVLPIPLEEAWAFFSDPSKLPVITPPSLNLSPTSPLPSEMHPGMVVTYKISPFPGLKLLWVTEITHVQDRAFFVDEQRAGPYSFWHHQHHFQAVTEGTAMHDIVHFAVPFGVLGDIAGGGTVRRKVKEIFAYRRKALDERFGRSPGQRTPHVEIDG